MKNGMKDMNNRCLNLSGVTRSLGVLEFEGLGLSSNLTSFVENNSSNILLSPKSSFVNLILARNASLPCNRQLLSILILKICDRISNSQAFPKFATHFS